MKKMFLRNKRGDIPVTILVIGVFVICTLAILSFKFFSIKSIKNFGESIEAVQEMNAEIQKYHFYRNLNLDYNRLLGTNKNYLEVEKELIKVRYLLQEG